MSVSLRSCSLSSLSSLPAPVKCGFMHGDAVPKYAVVARLQTQLYID